jgi:soluble lytic murein transglycosylase
MMRTSKTGFNNLIRITLILLLVIIALLLLTKYIINQHHISMRQQIVAVEKVSNTQQEQSDANQFKTSILYPYYVYNDLSSRLNTLPVAEVSNFITKYSDTPLAEKMRKQWLQVLASKQQWQTFLQFYQESSNSSLQCLDATALLRTGNVSEAYDMAETLWMVPYSQSPDCNALFAVWMSDNQLTVDMIWQRFHSAIDVNQIALAGYLVTLLPTDQQPLAKIWLDVRANPKLILNTKLFPPNDNSQNDILTYGIQRMAATDPDQAANAWNGLRVDHQFTSEQSQQAIQAIAIGFIKGDHKRAHLWLQQIDPAYLNTTAKSWRLRFAIEEQNWPLLINWINQLSPVDRNDPQWQYWYARALEQTGNAVKAKNIYKELSTQSDYYGFLSCVRLGIPFRISNTTKNISHADIQQFLANPGIQRMRALYAINKTDLANAEWWFALQNMEEEQRYVAIKMIAKWKMYSLALSSSTMLSDQHDLTLLYPKPYWRHVKKMANAFNIDPAFIYAIVRQESLFNPQAVSYVGAQGLMQLMPATAKMLVQQDKLPKSYADNLTDPLVNIQLGAIYLSRLLNSNNVNPALAAAAYNAGPGRIKQWLPQQGSVDIDIWVDSIPYPETRNYVKHVLTYMVIYQSLLGNQPSLQKALQPVSRS